MPLEAITERGMLPWVWQPGCRQVQVQVQALQRLGQLEVRSEVTSECKASFTNGKESMMRF